MSCLQRLCLLWSLVALFGSRMSVHAEAPPRPNILFAVADDWSYGHAGIYGCNWVKTPAVDRLAQQGLLFTHAFTPNGKCAPSRACILTGRNSWQLKAAANHWCYFPSEFKTYAEALAENGYFVGMTGKGWAPGIATNSDGFTRQMVGKPFDKRTLKPPTTKISPNDYAANFADFLDAAPKGKPWSFWFGCREPHREYELGSGVTKGGKKVTDIDRVPSRWPGGNPETGYLETDGSPTKTAVLDTRFIPAQKYFWDICYGKRPADEIYDVRHDPDCLTNLAATVSSAVFQQQLFTELKQQGDPRMSGDGHVFDVYPDASPALNFYERWMNGEKVKAGWVNESDFQAAP